MYDRRHHDRPWVNMFCTVALDTTTIILLSALGIFILLLLGISSICIWPFLFSAAAQESSTGELARQLQLCGWITLGAGALWAILQAWIDENYSLIKSFTFTLLVCMVTCFVSMVGTNADIFAFMGGSHGSAFLSVLVHGIVGLTLSVAPALAAVVAGFIIRLIWFIVYSIRR